MSGRRPQYFAHARSGDAGSEMGELAIDLLHAGPELGVIGARIIAKSQPAAHFHRQEIETCLQQ